MHWFIVLVLILNSIYNSNAFFHSLDSATPGACPLLVPAPWVCVCGCQKSDIKKISSSYGGADHSSSDGDGGYGGNESGGGGEENLKLKIGKVKEYCGCQTVNVTCKSCESEQENPIHIEFNKNPDWVVESKKPPHNRVSVQLVCAKNPSEQGGETPQWVYVGQGDGMPGIIVVEKVKCGREEYGTPSVTQSTTAASSSDTETTPAETETTPAETEISPAETETTPAETETTPAKTETSAAETETTPAETETTPAKTETSPAETETTSAETETTPAETETTPAETETTPAETETTPADTETTPAETETTPAETETTKAETETTPAETETTPAETETTPAETESSPAETETTPAETETTPAETETTAAETDATRSPTAPSTRGGYYPGARSTHSSSAPTTPSTRGGYSPGARTTDSSSAPTPPPTRGDYYTGTSGIPETSTAIPPNCCSDCDEIDCNETGSDCDGTDLQKPWYSNTYTVDSCTYINVTCDAAPTGQRVYVEFNQNGNLIATSSVAPFNKATVQLVCVCNSYGSSKWKKYGVDGKPNKEIAVKKATCGRKCY